MCLTRHIDSPGGGKTGLVVAVIIAEKAGARGEEVSVL
jgi:hypothetical protein